MATSFLVSRTQHTARLGKVTPMNTQTTQLTVPTMTCASCSRRVRAALAELTGIEKVDIRLGSRQVHITHDPDAIPVAELVNAIQNAGYGVSQDSAPSPVYQAARR